MILIAIWKSFAYSSWCGCLFKRLIYNISGTSYLRFICPWVILFLYCEIDTFLMPSLPFIACRMDVLVFMIWELIILAFLVFSAVSLYFRRMRLAFILVCVTMLLLLCMKITKQVRLARKKKRRMLLPLSM